MCFWLWESVARGSQLLAPELLQSQSLGELGETPLTFEDPLRPISLSLRLESGLPSVHHSCSHLFLSGHPLTKKNCLSTLRLSRQSYHHLKKWSLEKLKKERSGELWPLPRS